MSDASIKLEGASDLAVLLRAMPGRMATNVMRGAIRAGAAVFRDEARARVHIGHDPLPKGHDPGQLKRDITVASSRAQDGEIVSGVYIKARSFWWRFVEYGTQAKAAVRGKRSHHSTKAYPFIRPAADEGNAKAAARVVEYASARVVAAAMGQGLLDAAEAGEELL